MEYANANRSVQRAHHPGANKSSIVFGDDSVEAPVVRTAGVGKAGSTCDNTIGSVPSVKVHHAPGGHSSISFGDDSAPDNRFAAPAPAPQAPQVVQASPAAPVSAPFDTSYDPAQDFSTHKSRTANRASGAGALQNTGNTIGDVPSVKLHHAPGGNSSICFGEDSGPGAGFTPPVAAPVAPPVQRPVIAAHAPGGNSTISFGDGSTDVCHTLLVEMSHSCNLGSIPS